MELWWNFGGTLTELSKPDNQRVVAFFGTIVELWWNFDGTLVELWWNFEGTLEGVLRNFGGWGKFRGLRTVLAKINL